MTARDVLNAFWGLLKATAVEWWNDNTFRMAAALSFYMIFSLSPLLVIAIGAAGLLFGEEQARERIADEIGRLIGPQGGSAVERMTEQAEFAAGSPWAIAIGLGMLVLGSTVVFAELQAALNQIWDVQADSRRSGIWKIVRDRLLSFGLVLAVALLLLVSLLISTALAAAEARLTRWVPEAAGTWQWANQIAFVFITAALFALIYRYLPDARIRWRDVAVGAVVTSVLFNSGKYLIGLYLGQTAGTSAYGAAGSFAVFLIWMYYSSLICFFGAEFTQVYSRRYGARIRPSSHAVRVGEKADEIQT
jgi:membrane protein